MALPLINISTSLVASQIGENSNDVGTLCNSTKVNMWSKWKPIRLNKKVGITLSDLEGVNFGIRIPAFTSLANLKSAYAAGTANYTYSKPRGEFYNEPFRLGDFRNYKHASSSPMAGYRINEKVYLNSTEEARALNGVLFLSSGSDADEISFYDIDFGGYKYVGIAVYDSNNVFQKIYINTTEGATNVSVDITTPPALAAGEYNTFMFISSSKTQTTNIIGIHGTSKIIDVLSVKDSKIVINITAKWVEDSGSTRTVRVKVNISNDLGFPVTITGISVLLRFANKSFYDTLISGERIESLSNITLSDGGSTTFDVDFTNVEYSASWVVWWDNGGTYANRIRRDILTVIPD